MQKNYLFSTQLSQGEIKVAIYLRRVKEWKLQHIAPIWGVNTARVCESLSSFGEDIPDASEFEEMLSAVLNAPPSIYRSEALREIIELSPNNPQVLGVCDSCRTGNRFTLNEQTCCTYCSDTV